MRQDTHFIDKEENYIRTQWRFECYFSSFASNARGVAILLNDNFEFKVHKVEKDDKGNKLILTIVHLLIFMDQIKMNLNFKKNYFRR